MRILVAEDESVTRRLIAAALRKRGYDIEEVQDGQAALAALAKPDGPRMALLDWNMPELTGPEVCRRVREAEGLDYSYLVLLTARTEKSEVVEGLDAGADDFIIKPFHPGELEARLRVGERILRLETDLKTANENVGVLEGLLPVCMHCRRIRDDEQRWQRMETYLEQRAGARITHGLCESCLEEHYPNTDAASPAASPTPATPRSRRASR